MGAPVDRGVSWTGCTGFCEGRYGPCDGSLQHLGRAWPTQAVPGLWCLWRVSWAARPRALRSLQLPPVEPPASTPYPTLHPYPCSRSSSLRIHPLTYTAHPYTPNPPLRSRAPGRQPLRLGHRVAGGVCGGGCLPAAQRRGGGGGPGLPGGAQHDHQRDGQLAQVGGREGAGRAARSGVAHGARVQLGLCGGLGQP